MSESTIVSEESQLHNDDDDDDSAGPQATSTCVLQQSMEITESTIVSDAISCRPVCDNLCPDKAPNTVLSPSSCIEQLKEQVRVSSSSRKRSLPDAAKLERQCRSASRRLHLTLNSEDFVNQFVAEVKTEVWHCAVCLEVEYANDDRWWIQCDRCLCWMHGECVFLEKPTRRKKWYCPNCITFI